MKTHTTSKRTTPTPLEKMRELTRRLVAVPKSEIPTKKATRPKRRKSNAR
jgi:hypothetical protein